MNFIYKETFFNISTKERYLSKFDESAKLSYGRILKRAAIMENSFGYDLYDFNFEQIKQLLLLLQSKTISTIMGAGNIVSNYIRWAIEQDLRKDNINPMEFIFQKEQFEKLVHNKDTLFSEDQIDEIVDGLTNYQDKALVQALFEGISGKMFSELLNAKVSHISHSNNKNIMTVYEDCPTGCNSREIRISSKLITLLERANNESVYLKNNGVFNPEMKVTYSNLTNNGCIFKSVKNAKVLGSLPSVSHMVSRRIKRISKYFNLPNLTPLNIRNSGMLRMAKDLYVERKSLDRDEYNELCSRYNVGTPKNGNYHYSRIKRDFLNIENIKEVYGVDNKISR